MGKCHGLYPCLEQVQHSFTEYKSYVYHMFKSPTVNLIICRCHQWSRNCLSFGENEFIQGFNGVHIARSLVSCFFHDISRGSGILKGPVVKSTPVNGKRLIIKHYQLNQTNPVYICHGRVIFAVVVLRWVNTPDATDLQVITRFDDFNQQIMIIKEQACAAFNWRFTHC